jgi:hypothetical protein
MAGNITASVQQQFSSTILTLLKEGKGGKLVEFTENDKNVEGDTYFFYRIGESTTKDDIDLYAAGHAGTAGDMLKIAVEPKFAYADDFKKEHELAKTKLDIKSAYMKSFKSAVERKEDKVILDAIAAEDAALMKRGNGTSTLDAQFDELVKAIAYAQAMVEDNDAHGTNVAVVLNKVDYADLFAADKFASSDFFKISDVGTTLAGGKLIPTGEVPSGTVYIIPKNTVCFASWKGGDKAVMDYNSGKDGYYMWARKSVGATCAEPESIIKFSAKPATPATFTAPMMEGPTTRKR